MKRKLALIVSIALTLLVLTIALRSVMRFASSPPGKKNQEAEIRSLKIENPYTPEVHQVSDDQAAQLRTDLEKSAYSALMNLEHSDRPSQPDAREIAQVFAEFVSICSTGDPEDHVRMVESRGREPDKRFLNPEKKDGFWRTNTGWAREAPLDIDGVWARPRSIHGTNLDISRTGLPDGPGTIRRFANGGMPFLEPNDRTIYEVIIPATLASTSGERVKGSVGVMITDDAKIRTWDTLGVMSHGVPQGFVIFLTPP